MDWRGHQRKVGHRKKRNIERRGGEKVIYITDKSHRNFGPGCSGAESYSKAKDDFSISVVRIY